MADREKIAIAVLCSLIFWLYIFRIFMEQQLVEINVQNATVMDELTRIRTENLTLQTTIWAGASLGEIAARAKQMGFVDFRDVVVIH